MQLVFAVGGHALLEGGDLLLESRVVGRHPLLGDQPCPFVVTGGGVLAGLGQADVAARGRQRRAERAVLQLHGERVEDVEVGSEHHEPDVGLLPQHAERQDLVAVAGVELLDPLQQVAGGVDGVLQVAAAEVEEQVEHAPSLAGHGRHRRPRLWSAATAQGTARSDGRGLIRWQGQA